MNRRYTLAEIDALRQAVCVKNYPSYPALTYTGSSNKDGGYMRMVPQSAAALDRWERNNEEQLRTCMAAGIGPEDFPEGGKRDD